MTEKKQKDTKISPYDTDYILNHVKCRFEQATLPDDEARVIPEIARMLRILNEQDGISARAVKIRPYYKGTFKFTFDSMLVHLEVKDTEHDVIAGFNDYKKVYEPDTLKLYMRVEQGSLCIYEPSFVSGADYVKKTRMDFDTKEGRTAFFDLIARKLSYSRYCKDMKELRLEAANKYVDQAPEQDPQEEQQKPMPTNTLKF